jgi:hypothetical protein
VRITSDTAHRVLTYIAAVTDQGHRLSVRAANAYQRAAAMASRPRGLMGLVTIFGDPEAAPGNLQDLGWAWVDGENNVWLTSLGRAVLRALDQQEVEGDEPFDVVLNAEDPLAYPQVISRVAMHKDALLVDPYFKLEHLLHVVHNTTASRLLTGPKADLPGLSTALSSSLPADRKLEVRVSEEVHDRYIIPSSGPLDMIGTSLSGVGKGKPSAMIRVEPPAADAIRGVCEDLWDRAKPLEVVPADTRTEALEGSDDGHSGAGDGKSTNEVVVDGEDPEALRPNPEA